MIGSLVPKNTKYKTSHMYKLHDIKKTIKLDYGKWGIISCENGIITPNQIESARCCISRYIKNKGKIWIKILPNHIISKKPKDSRMGSGKGKMLKYISVIRPGLVIFEATELPLFIIFKILNLIKAKLPIKVKLIINKNVV